MTLSAPSLGVTDLTVSDLTEVFAAASDPTRVEMLRLLATSEEVACTTFEHIFPISKSTISYHIKVLRHAGLIQVRKDGTFYYYTLRRAVIERHLPGFLELVMSTVPRGHEGPR